MPAFMFEKISPPVRRGSGAAIAVKEPRGLIVQMLDRITETRLKREANKLRKSRDKRSE